MSTFIFAEAFSIWDIVSWNGQTPQQVKHNRWGGGLSAESINFIVNATSKKEEKRFIILHEIYGEGTKKKCTIRYIMENYYYFIHHFSEKKKNYRKENLVWLLPLDFTFNLTP